MVYLDYSATTPVNSEVIDTFLEVSKKYFGNPNSLHKLGSDSKRLIDAATSQIADILKISEKEIIYTSGAVEANNTAIYGVCDRYKNRGCHIITTELEHSSILDTLEYFKKDGFRVSYVKLDDDGRVDLEDLDNLMDDDTILVSISLVNSEIGILQDLESISKVVRKYPKVILHSDITQALGKVDIDFSLLDLASMSAQKIYGLKGIGMLYKRDGLEITPLIKGGKSTTIYRSGTPATPLIASLSKALRIAFINKDEKYKHVLELNKYLVERIKNIDNVHINSTKYSIPHIVNISVDNVKAEVMLHALEEKDIYISTRTACSTSDKSIAVYAITHNDSFAKHSLRISISHLTTFDELDFFLKEFADEIKRFSSLK